MMVFGKDRDVFSRGDGSHAEGLLQRAKIMDDEKQSINISSNKKRGYIASFLCVGLCLLSNRPENCLSNLHEHDDTKGNAENDCPLHKAWRGYIEELIDSRSNDYA